MPWLRNALALPLALMLAVSPLQASYKFRGSAGTDKITLSTGAIPRTGTVCLVVKAADFASANNFPLFIASTGSGTSFYNSLIYSGQVIGGFFSGGSGQVAWTGLPTNAAWNWLCTTTDSASFDQKLYVNSNTARQTYNDGQDRTWTTTGTAKIIGYNADRAVSNTADIYIAEVAMWSVVLDATKLGHLMTDHYAASCYSTSLVSYWPLSANANDSVGSDNGTASGAALDGSHPTVDGACGGGPPPATGAFPLMGVQ